MTDQHDDPTDGGPTDDGPTDSELLNRLKESFESLSPTPAEMVDMIMAGYDLTNIDLHMAELIADTAIDEPVGVRSTSTASRLLTFERGDMAFEFEVAPQEPQIVGHLEPPVAGSIRLEQADHVVTVELDDLARYEFTLRSTAPFRLVYVPGDATPIATDWLLP